MLHTIEGVYRNGEVALKEQPKMRSEIPVLVTFLSPSVISADSLSDDTEQAAWQRIQNQMEKGHPLGGAPYGSRDELHERQHKF